MKYEAHVTGREGRWWAVEIPALGENAQTQARRLAEVESEARDYISVTLDVAPSSVHVQVIVDDFAQVYDVQERSAWIRAARRLIEQLENDVQRETRALTAELTAEGVPLREIAYLVGTTFQRVGQLAAEEGADATRSAWAISERNPEVFERAREAFLAVTRVTEPTPRRA